MDDLMGFGLPALIGVVTGLIVFLALRAERLVLAVALIVLPAITGGVLWAMAEQAYGYDGLGYAIVAVMGCAPAVAGGLLGVLVAWLARAKRAE